MVRTGLIISATAIALVFGAWIWLGASLLESAAHWAISATTDRLISHDAPIAVFARWPNAGLLPALLLAFMPFIQPFRRGLHVLHGARFALWIGMELLLALATIGIALLVRGGAANPKGVSEDSIRLMFACVGVLFMLLGDVLTTARSNSLLGVRTPWTLASALSWEKTHLLGGRLVELLGLWQVVAAVTLSVSALPVAIITPAPVLALILSAYSYAAWRNDPNRLGP